MSVLMNQARTNTVSTERLGRFHLFSLVEYEGVGAYALRVTEGKLAEQVDPSASLVSSMAVCQVV